MRNWRALLGNERGVALVLSLMMLLALTGLLLAFLSVSAMEPQISRNVADTARARYLAEAGIEIGYNMMVNTGDATQSFTPAVTSGTTGAPWVALVTNGTLAGVTTGGATAEAAFAGTYNVVVRNDYLASDQNLTGVNPTTTTETVSADNNKIVIMRSTGTFNGATKTIEVVVRRASLPPFPGAVNLPGLQTDTLINDTTFDIDGRDYGCSAGCDNAANWNTTANAMKYGIATVDGVQANKSPTTYEENIEAAVSGSSSKYNDIKGKSEDGTYSGVGCSSPCTSGLKTIQGLSSTDPAALTPAKMADYLDQVRNYAGTTILQSTQACPMQLTGSTSGQTNTPTLTNGCTGSAGVNQTLNLGTRTDPKLVYFRGDIDTSSQFTGLTMNSGIKGAGILIIEDGDFKQLGNFTWDGVVIVTGSYVGAGFRNGSTTLIRGAFVANEAIAGEASGFFEFLMDDNTSFTTKSSKQNVDMVQLMRGATTMTNWREL
jgi:Tfp pilus assembly protein PilX